MRAVLQEFESAVLAKRGVKSTRRQRTTRDCQRVALRLSVDDNERLKELADGMALATFIRAKVLDDQLPKRKRRSSASVADKQASAQILGLLGNRALPTI